MATRRLSKVTAWTQNPQWSLALVRSQAAQARLTQATNHLKRLLLYTEYAPSLFMRFKPLFTHQSFGMQEQVSGLTEPCISIDWTLPAFQVTCRVAASNLLDTADAAFTKVAGQLREGLPDATKVCLAGSSPVKAASPDQPLAEAVLQHPSATVLTAYSTHDLSTLPTGLSGRFKAVECRLAESPPAQQLLGSLQFLAMWLIDAASTIDVTDPHWHVLFLFAEVQGAGWCPVGYTTLFTFHTPTRVQAPLSVRLAQCLVLPPLHRQGHGAAMLRAAHRWQESLGSFQLTVEDPADAFRRLRDAHDIQLARARAPEGEVPDKDATAAGLDGPPSPEQLAALQQALHITESQCLRVSEAFALARLLELACEARPSSAASLVKAFRLRCKRRAFAQDPDLRAVPADMRKAELARQFAWDLSSYTAGLRRAGVPGTERIAVLFGAAET